MNTTNLKQYLISISKYPLLTAKEELELAYRMRDGDEDARQTLITSNLRLVVSIAKNYKNAHLSLEDLINEGNLGLFEAVKRYDPDLKYRFSTCATPWIRQAISKALIDNGRQIRLPANVYQMLHRYNEAVDKLTNENKEISDINIAKELGVTAEKAANLREWRQTTISLETPLGDDGEDTLMDLQEDKYDESPTAYTEKELLREQITKVLSDFPERTQKIIRLRYGLGENEFSKEHTLEEIGEILGLTRERVRQIEKETLTILRNKLRDTI